MEIRGEDPEVSVRQVWVPWISEGFLGFIPRIGEVNL